MITNLVMQMHAKFENFTREVRSIEKKRKFWKRKNVVTKIKNPIDKFNCRLDTAEKRNSNLKDKLIENIQQNILVILVL